MLLIAWPSWAQSTGPPASAPIPAQPENIASPTPMMVYGRVLMEDGQPVPEPVSVELECGIELMQAIHTDLKGNFQFNLGEAHEGNSTETSASQDTPLAMRDAPVDAPAGTAGLNVSPHQMFGCEVHVSVAGYQPLSKTISESANVGGINIGTLVLTRIAGMQGAAISMTSLSAPKKSRQEFEKGEKDARDKHLDSAIQHFEKAVAEYGTYAVAWNELGRIYAINHRTDDARQAFTKAMTADPHYIPPCMGLAQLELQSGQYEAAIEAAAKALSLSPGMAAASFLEAVANFRLNRLDAAEKSARDAENAPHENIPQLHVLLADILIQKKDYSNAAEEMKAYLRVAPQGEFASQIRKRLEDVEKSAADAGKTLPTPDSQSQPAPQSQASSSTQTGLGALKVSLRMPDNAPFVGLASIRVMPAGGYQVVGTPSGADGETIFANLLPGTYMVEANAPGFLAVQEQTDIEARSRLHTLFLIMKPVPLPETDAQLSASPLAPMVAGDSSRVSWIPPGIDSAVPGVQPGATCPLAQVVSGAGRRMKELVENLQKFDATEQIEHFNVDAAGSRSYPETRTFDYLVIITLSDAGVFLLDEYRNGRIDNTQFPAQIATTGLASMALIFHPSQVSGFNLTCEGLGQWNGRPAWQVHFTQRADRPNRTREYVVGQEHFPVPLKGRAWIDAGTYQVLRWESELMKPVKEIDLTQEYMAIDYGPVQFQTHNRQLWLPLDAEVYWERHGHRYYRRHSFSNFKLFEVQTAQQIQSPEQSYCFKNTSDQDIAGHLTVSSVAGTSTKDISILLTIPSGRSVCKIVGPGKDVSIPADEVRSATLTYDGSAGSITAEANLVKETVLDLVPEGTTKASTP